MWLLLSDVTWATWRPKSPATRLCVQQLLVQTSKKTSTLSISGPLGWQSTCHHWYHKMLAIRKMFPRHHNKFDFALLRNCSFTFITSDRNQDQNNVSTIHSNVTTKRFLQKLDKYIMHTTKQHIIEFCKWGIYEYCVGVYERKQNPPSHYLSCCCHF